MATSNGVATVLVSVQTMRGHGGLDATIAEVNKAVADYNKVAKAAHTVEIVRVLPNNTKGLAWQLALYATLARMHGASMVRLSVHGGAVAVCGPKSTVAATVAAMKPKYIEYSTAATAAYNPAAHGNRVGFLNAWLCGAPAGLQTAAKVETTLAYGLGYLYPFATPANVSAYKLGYTAALGAASTAKAAPKPAQTAKTPAANRPKAALVPLAYTAQQEKLAQAALEATPAASTAPAAS